MRTLLIFLAAVAALLGAAAPARPAEPSYADRVVRILVTYQRVEERRPWTRSAIRTREAMGVVVEGPFLLTTAQMVGDATFIEVEKGGGPVRVPARVHHVDHEINLALLAVDAPGFFQGLIPVAPAREATPGSPVTLARWEQGQLETADSRVARIQVEAGPTSEHEHLFYRVKSDFTGGGWAEPVFTGEEFLGLVVAQNNGNQALVMPSEIITAYLRAARDPRIYRGFATLPLTWQENRSPALASRLGLPGEPRGVLVLNTPWGATGCGVLKARDILLSLDGNELDAEGYYRHPRYGRLRFTNLAVEGHQAGDVVTAEVFRDGVVQKLPLELRRYAAETPLVPWSAPDARPAYQIAGGLAFRELDRNYLAAGGKNWRQEADARLLTYLDLDRHAQQPGRRRIVILSSVLPSAYNIGYHRLRDLAVGAVNGVPIGGLADLVEGLRHPRGGFHTITFLPNPVIDEVVLDAGGMAQADADLLKNYRVDQAGHPGPGPPPDPGPLPLVGP